MGLCKGLSQIPQGCVCIFPSWQCFSGQVPLLSMLTHLGVHLGQWPRWGVGEPGQQWAPQPRWHFCICGYLRSQTHTPQCGAAEQMILPPHSPIGTAGLFKTLARWKGTRVQDQEPASPMDKSYVGAAWTWPDLVLPQWWWGKSNLGGQGQPLITFSSQKLHVPAWLCSGFSFPFMARPCTSEAVACSGLPLAGGIVPYCTHLYQWVPKLLLTYGAHRCMQAGKGLVSRTCKPFLVLTCTFVSPVWQ